MRKIFTTFILVSLGSWCWAQTYISTFPYAESFDSIAFDNTTFGPGAEPFPAGSNGLFVNNWQNSQSDSAVQDWYGRSTATGSSNTGPTADHTGGGRYIFVEDGWDNYNDVTLESPFFDLTGVTGSNWTISYWVHSQTLVTSSFNFMVVQLWTASSNSWVTIDSFANLSTTDTWFLRSANIDAAVGDTAQIRFVGDNSGQGFEHDIALDDFSLFQNNMVVSASVLDNNNCGGGTEGVAVVSVSMGNGPLTYSWSGGISAQDTASGLAAGTYVVTVIDSLGGSGTDTVTIVDLNTPISPAITVMGESCPGTGDGWAVIDSVNGGVGSVICAALPTTCTSPSTDTIGFGTVNNTSTGYPSPFGNWYWGARHQMMWRASELTAAGLQAGKITSLAWDIAQINGTTSYDNVTIQMGCTSDSTMANGYISGLQEVYSPQSYTISAGWNTLVFDEAYIWDGTSNIVVEFCFNNSGFTNNPLHNLTTTSFTSVRYYRADISGVCSNTTSTTGTSSNRPNVVFGHCAELPGYTFDWSTGVSGDSLTSLTTGSYVVTVTDAIGCTVEDTVNVNSISDPQANLTANDVSCNGLNDGSVASAVSGGVGAYTYAWSNSGTTASINGLGAGTYTVTITDSVGCSVTDTASITEPTAVAVSVTGLNLLCNGDGNGTVTANASGGTASSTGLVLITEVSANSPDFVEIQNVTSVPIDVTGWTVAVSSSYTNINQANTQVWTLNGVWAPGQIDFREDATGANYWGNNIFWASGNPSYAILLDAQGNVMDFVVWGWAANDIAGFNANIAGFTNVTIGNEWNGAGIPAACTGASGFSRIGNSDNNNLSDWACVTTTKGTTNNNMSTNFAGAVTYNFAWNTGDTIGSLDSLSGGTYVVTVTDENGCSISDSITLLEPDSLALTVATTPVSCFGLSDGTATATVTGGIPSYSFAWSTGTNDTSSSSSTDTGFVTGTFIVTVTDANGCSESSFVVIGTPTQVAATSSFVEPSCFGLTDASATVTASGGNPGYNYAWPGGLTGPTQAGLGAGSYAVSVTDSTNCEVIETITITQPDSIGVAVSGTDVNCVGGSDGAAQVAASGGVGGFTYLWMPGSLTTDSISGLGAGVYTVTVTDSNGCDNTGTITLAETNQNPIIDLGADVDACDGDTVFLVGPSNLSYLWCDGSTDPGLPITGPTTCGVTVTDSNGCTGTDEITIGFNPLPDPGLADADTICEGNDFIITPGQNFVTYQWSDFSFGTTLTVSTPGLYCVTVTDANGCSNEDCITLASDPCVGIPELGDGATVQYFPNPTNGLLNVQVEGMEGKDLALEVLTVQGQLVQRQQFNDVPAFFNSQLNLESQAQGLYLIRMTSGTRSVVHRISVK